VRLVTCKADGEKWAVKIIEKSKINPGDHSLQTEIDILCRVDQENCVCLKEWFDEPKRVLLVMEFVTGGGAGMLGLCPLLFPLVPLPPPRLTEPSLPPLPSPPSLPLSHNPGV
jgi:serine/threonine protein kinase